MNYDNIYYLPSMESKPSKTSSIFPCLSGTQHETTVAP